MFGWLVMANIINLNDVISLKANVAIVSGYSAGSGWQLASLASACQCNMQYLSRISAASVYLSRRGPHGWPISARWQ